MQLTDVDHLRHVQRPLTVRGCDVRCGNNQWHTSAKLKAGLLRPQPLLAQMPPTVSGNTHPHATTLSDTNGMIICAYGSLKIASRLLLVAVEYHDRFVGQPKRLDVIDHSSHLFVYEGDSSICSTYRRQP